jgi:hypothetical protein
MRAADLQPVFAQYRNITEHLSGKRNLERRGPVPVDHRLQTPRARPLRLVEFQPFAVQPAQVHLRGKQFHQAFEIIGGQLVFRAVGAQEADILRGTGLCSAGCQFALEWRRMHTVDDDQPRHQLRSEHRQPVGRRSPPVMADHRHPLSERIDERRHVRDQLAHLVGGHLRRSPALAKATLIGRDAMIAVGKPCRDFLPRSAVFGEAVQEQQDRRTGPAPLEIVERLPVQLDKTVARVLHHIS